MEVRLLKDIPVHPNHEMRKDGIFDVVQKEYSFVWVQSAVTGAKVKLFEHEYQEVKK